MIEAIKKRIFTKRALLAFVIAYFAWGELSTSGQKLWENIQFCHQSEPAMGKVVDVRHSEVKEYYEILSSGAIALQGDSLYQPIVSYPSPSEQMLLCVELPTNSKQAYERGEVIPIRILKDNHLIAKENHGLFLWGGDLLHILIGLIAVGLALFLIKRTKVIRSIVPAMAPTIADVVIPTKKRRRSTRKKTTTTSKKSTATKKEAAPKKRTSRKKSEKRINEAT